MGQRSSPIQQHQVSMLKHSHISPSIFCFFRICLADAIASFNWGNYLNSTSAHGAPVNLFRHVKTTREFKI